ncbi:beta 1-4 rhamnosyltransferase Cps2T [Bifidobacterium adolescentis]|uniref:beta 1-4 rhamnosyltransferase Cps2T n=1 Tax=Bifidobacterium adolescentis TaxID=1680 RepID=UPI000A231BE3|nr:glycosyltransferase family 1 protein [Bifidobacterium adolescentis]OSH00744.1 glycosyl transferase [Bifidobacterium adolescentis]
MLNDSSVQHVFIVGSKGIPGNYGGYETFVDKLTEYHQNNPNLKYHVACKAKDTKTFEYHNADCFDVKVPSIGPAQAIYYDVAALNQCVRYIKRHNIQHPIVYILACRIGPFAAHFQRVIHKLGGKLYINPDGHEWMRAKWSAPVRKYWKISEQLMTKHCDLLICDSKNIEDYIHDEYGKYNPKTTFISYGAETRKSKLADDDPKLIAWYKEKGLSPKSYYLVVGRFVPENNYETMIREFMKSHSKRDFALITNVSDKFLEELKEKTHFDQDSRIKFVGTVYDKELLMKIRENAYGYFHGHEVGGTNPSLLEALGSTDLNLLLDVGFNREVAEDSALYWTKQSGNLASLIDWADGMNADEISELGKKASLRIVEAYSWQHIADEYESRFFFDVRMKLCVMIVEAMACCFILRTYKEVRRMFNGKIG